jgi:hypothetical protein
MITLILPISITFSLLKLAEGRNLSIQEPTFMLSNGNISVTIPVYINNAGFYDISETSMQVKVWKADLILFEISKNLPDIPAGQKVKVNCIFTTNFKEILQMDRELLTKDDYLNVNTTFHFKVAHLIAFNATNISIIQWGAPFHNLTIYGEAYNITSQVFSFYVSFNNHAPFPINGTLTARITNLSNETISVISLNLNVQPKESFVRLIEVIVDPLKMMDNAFVQLSFDNLEVFWRPVRHE